MNFQKGDIVVISQNADRTYHRGMVCVVLNDDNGPFIKISVLHARNSMYIGEEYGFTRHKLSPGNNKTAIQHLKKVW